MVDSKWSPLPTRLKPSHTHTNTFGQQLGFGSENMIQINDKNSMVHIYIDTFCFNEISTLPLLPVYGKNRDETRRDTTNKQTFDFLNKIGRLSHWRNVRHQGLF